MREDIVGMLKNAMERGGRPEQVARSLINSGYNAAEVQQALSFVTGGTLSSLNTAQQQQLVNVRPFSPAPTMAQQPAPYPQAPQAQYQQYARPLPAMRQQYSGPGLGKLIALIAVLLLLAGGLISAIIFKDNILDFFG